MGAETAAGSTRLYRIMQENAMGVREKGLRNKA